MLEKSLLCIIMLATMAIFTKIKKDRGILCIRKNITIIEIFLSINKGNYRGDMLMNLLSENQTKADLSHFKDLFESHNKKVYRVAFYIIKNEQDAKDIVQEAFTIAFRKLHTLKDQSKFEQWICKIACNLAKEKYKKNKREVLTEDYENVVSYIEAKKELFCQEDEIEKKELKEYLLKQINGLKTHYREVILLYYYFDMSYEEISVFLNVNIGTIKSRLARAKQILRGNIVEDNENQDNLLLEERGSLNG